MSFSKHTQVLSNGLQMRWFCLIVKLEQQKPVAIGAAMSSQILLDSLIYTVIEEDRGGGGEAKKWKVRDKGGDFLVTGCSYYNWYWPN